MNSSPDIAPASSAVAVSPVVVAKAAEPVAVAKAAVAAVVAKAAAPVVARSTERVVVAVAPAPAVAPVAASTRSVPAADDSLQAMVGAPQQPSRRRSVLVFAAAAMVLLGAGGAGLAALRAPSHVDASMVMRARELPAPPAARAAATASPAPARVEPGLDPGALPAAGAAAPAPSAAPSARAHALQTAVVAAAPSPAATDSAPAKLTALDLAPSAVVDPGDLAGAMRSAVGPEALKDAFVTDNAKNANARQIRPPPGQVVGAINSVLPSARACLGPDDPVRTGSVVFASDGSVAHVTLQGAKPSDACVRTALSKARVQSFADDTFTTHITVRP